MGRNRMRLGTLSQVSWGSVQLWGLWSRAAAMAWPQWGQDPLAEGGCRGGPLGPGCLAEAEPLSVGTLMLHSGAPVSKLREAGVRKLSEVRSLA